MLFFCMQSDFVIYVNSGVTCNTYLRYIADWRALDFRYIFSPIGQITYDNRFYLHTTILFYYFTYVPQYSFKLKELCDTCANWLTFYFRFLTCRLPSLHADYQRHRHFGQNAMSTLSAAKKNCCKVSSSLRSNCL